MGKLNYDSEKISIEELSEMCEGLTGADIKSIVGDAQVKAFHRVTKSDNSFIFEGAARSWEEKKQTDDLVNLIKVEKEDLLTSIKAIRQTINFSERNKLKMM